VDLSAWEIAACLGIVLVGALVQGAIGFGVNLIATPVIALVAPGAVPGAVVLMSLPLTITMAAREHRDIDRRGVAWIFLGRLPGTLAGVAIVAAVSDSVLAAVVGGSILLAVLLGVTHPHLRVNRATAFAAGSVSGVTGTAAAVDGPPLALLYQHEHGPRLRSTLATCFVLGTVMSAIALGVAGEITRDQLRLTLILLPALLAGWGLSTFVAPHVDGRRLRVLVLTFAALTGAAALVRGLAAL
jgi:uncharacterized membrane protein YfcA